MHFVLCYVGYLGMIFEKVVLFRLSYRIYIVYIQLRIYSNSEYLAIHFWLLSSPLYPRFRARGQGEDPFIPRCRTDCASVPPQPRLQSPLASVLVPTLCVL